EMSQKLTNTGDDAFISKRRFTIAGEKGRLEGTLTYPLDDLLQQEKSFYVSVPKGVNRFKIQGAGANYVHGGAMLQEIVLPVITFKNDRSKHQKNIVKKVDVKLTTPTRKITN